MKKKEQKKKYKIWLFILVLTILDLITKSLFTNKDFLNNFWISINYTKNYGSSFGLFSSISFYNLLIILVSILILIVAIGSYKQFLKDKYLMYTFVFFISGLLGNTYDRIVYGYVRDFISLKYLFVFNLADFYFTLAAICYIVYEIKNSKKDSNKTTNKGNKIKNKMVYNKNIVKNKNTKNIKNNKNNQKNTNSKNNKLSNKKLINKK